MHIKMIILSSVTMVAFTPVITNGAEESQSMLLKRAKITEAQARNTALAKVVNGTVRSSELEREKGRLIWSFDIATPQTQNITEIQVDAKTGKTVSMHLETPSKQVKEAQSEK
ncbi:MAG: hypothetical protein QOI53_1499 [Verrucomicrobiota bacterium]|jgi:uncharacterized membrane protein YkoI|nr:hypothetical protein [Verrucomicrobiota bacterium]